MVDVLVIEKGELGGLLTTLLAQDGLNAQWARSSEEALEMAISSQPKVVVIETEVSEYTGIELADLFSAELDSKVVMTYRQETLSMPDGSSLLIRIEEQEASFKKPFRSRALIEKVALLLGKEASREFEPSLLEGVPVEEEEPLELNDVVDVPLIELNNEVLDGAHFLDVADEALDADFDIDLSDEEAVQLSFEMSDAELDALEVISAPTGKGATIDLPARDLVQASEDVEDAGLTSMWSELKALSQSGADLSQPSGEPVALFSDEEQAASEVGKEESFASLGASKGGDDQNRLANEEAPLVEGSFLKNTEQNARQNGAAFLVAASKHIPKEKFNSPQPPGGSLAVKAEVSPLNEAPRALSGRLLAETLDALHEGEATAEILLIRGEMRRVLLVLRGVIVGVRSNLRKEELPYLAQKRIKDAAEAAKKAKPSIEQPKMQKAQELFRAKKFRSLAHALLHLGVSEKTLRSLLDEQVRRVVLGAFAWPEGKMQLSFKGLAKKEALQVSLSVADAVVRSIVLHESLAELQKAAPDDARFAPSPDSSYGLQDVTLSTAEAHLVIAIDGTKTIGDLTALFGKMPERVLRGIAAGLFRVGLLRFAGFGHAEARHISFF